MLLSCVTCTDDSDSVGVRAECRRTVGLRVPQRVGRADLLQQWPLMALVITEVVRAPPRPRLGLAGGRRGALTTGTPRAWRRDVFGSDGRIPRAEGGRAGGRASHHAAGDTGRAGLGARCSEGQDQEPTSTNASVRSLARSITGKWRPATIFTFSFPGIAAAPASPRISAETNKRVCADRAPGGGGGARERAEGRRERAPTDSGGRTHALRRNRVVPRGRRGLIPEKQPEEGHRPAVLP